MHGEDMTRENKSLRRAIRWNINFHYKDNARQEF